MGTQGVGSDKDKVASIEPDSTRQDSPEACSLESHFASLFLPILQHTCAHTYTHVFIYPHTTYIYIHIHKIYMNILTYSQINVY